MQVQLFIFSYLSAHQFFPFTNALFGDIWSKSSNSIDLYQCDTNETSVHDNVFINQTTLSSCDSDCCIIEQLNHTSISNQSTSLMYSNTCQVTVRSSTGVCLGRLCYPDQCDHFLLLSNAPSNEKVNNDSTILTQIRSHLPSIPWRLLLNSTRTKWASWVDKSTLSNRSNMLISLLLLINISLTMMTLYVVIKSIKHATLIANKRSRRHSFI